MVVVTGMGAVSALGTGIDAHRAALREGRDGIRPITRFDTTGLATHLGATWPGWDGLVQTKADVADELVASVAPFPVHELALIAAREAWSSAGVRGVDHRRAAIVFGTCYGQTYVEFSAVTERIAAALDLTGPRVTISTACASSTNAIGLARDLLENDHADVVIAGGADALLREPFAGFSALGVLSADKCAPFSEPPGTTLGEGAGFVVLEREADASKRNADVWTRVFGYGLSADGHHETTPDPAGDGLARAIRGALADAGWDARSIDYVSAHATGTHNNDRIEHSVIERELGAPPTSGSKGHIGHVQGAAGVLELILAVLCHREGRVPPTLHFRGARPGCPADPIAASVPREARVTRALKLSAAFGGANAVLAYGVDAPVTHSSKKIARVVVTGHGVVGPKGALAAKDVLALGEERMVGACRGVDLDALGVDGRRLDRSSRWLTAAAAIARRKHAPGDATGLFVAATRMPTESSMRCTDSIQKRGAIGTSASAFARMSVNAPTGACSRALGLLGPTSTFSIDEGSGLLAIALAAEWLSRRDDAAAILAGAVDEPCGRYVEETEGAACVALERSIDPRAGEIVVAGWGLAGRDGARDAIDRAMSGRAAGTSGVFVDGALADAKKLLAPNAPIGVVDASAFWGTAHATRSCVMAAAAIARIEAGHGDSALLVTTRGASTVALVIERTRPR